jgi:hypothetical protein
MDGFKEYVGSVVNDTTAFQFGAFEDFEDALEAQSTLSDFVKENLASQIENVFI